MGGERDYKGKKSFLFKKINGTFNPAFLMRLHIFILQRALRIILKIYLCPVSPLHFLRNQAKYKNTLAQSISCSLPWACKYPQSNPSLSLLNPACPPLLMLSSCWKAQQILPT